VTSLSTTVIEEEVSNEEPALPPENTENDGAISFLASFQPMLMFSSEFMKAFWHFPACFSWIRC
jgi:hypothetical protein